MQSERKTLLNSSFFKVSHQHTFPPSQKNTVMEVCDEANYLLIGTQDWLIILNKNNFSEIRRILVKNNPVYSAKFYNQGKNILCFHTDRSLRSWDIEKKSNSVLIRQYEHQATWACILDCEKDKAVLSITAPNQRIEILNITEKSLITSPWILPDNFKNIYLSADKSLLICSSRSQAMTYIYSIKDQNLLTSIPIDHFPGLFLKATISFDNSLLIVANPESITLYNVCDKTVYKKISITDKYSDFLLTHENKYLIVCGELEKHQANIVVYDLSLEKIDQPIAKEIYDYSPAAFNPHLNEERSHLTVFNSNKLTTFRYQGSWGPKTKSYYSTAFFEMKDAIKKHLPIEIRSLIYTFLLRLNHVNDITTNEEFFERVKLLSKKISEPEAPVSRCALF